MLRFLWLVGFSLWMGGFVFYASFVVPILRREFLESASVTRHVAPIFNWLGVVVLASWFVELFVDRRRSTAWCIALVLVLANAVVLGVLFWAYYWVSGGSQDPDDPRFWFSHRVYLWLSTLQFVLSVASLAISLRRWREADAAESKASGEA